MQGSRLTSDIDHHGGGVDSIGIVGSHSHSVDPATGVHFGLHLHIKVILTSNNRTTVTKVPDVVSSKGLHQGKTCSLAGQLFRSIIMLGRQVSLGSVYISAMFKERK